VANEIGAGERPARDRAAVVDRVTALGVEIDAGSVSLAAPQDPGARLGVVAVLLGPQKDRRVAARPARAARDVARRRRDIGLLAEAGVLAAPVLGADAGESIGEGEDVHRSGPAKFFGDVGF
jgi:hypothetical protein